MLVSLTSCKPHKADSKSHGINIGPNGPNLNLSADEPTIVSLGVTYKLAQQKTTSLTDMTNGDFSYTGDTFSFAVKNRALTVNGKDMGTVKAGDTVSIDSSGAVSLNGTQQNPK